MVNSEWSSGYSPFTIHPLRNRRYPAGVCEHAQSVGPIDDRPVPGFARLDPGTGGGASPLAPRTARGSDVRSDHRAGDCGGTATTASAARPVRTRRGTRGDTGTGG